MEDIPFRKFKEAQNNSNWVAARARELKALFLFESAPMVAKNKTRALSNINTMQAALEELKQYVEGLEG